MIERINDIIEGKYEDPSKPRAASRCHALQLDELHPMSCSYFAASPCKPDSPRVGQSIQPCIRHALGFRAASKHTCAQALMFLQHAKHSSLA